jgi:hypothetical protein
MKEKENCKMKVNLTRILPKEEVNMFRNI